MSRAANLLKVKLVENIQEPGRYADGGGLYLLVRKRAKLVERLWFFRYRRGPRGKAHELSISLGPAKDVTLAVARETARRCRQALLAGQDPRQAALRAQKSVPTFGEAADDYVTTIEPTLRNAKHIAQWRMTLGDTYCRTLRKLLVSHVTTEHVMAVLKPIWLDKPETAQRLRGRIERVLDAAKVLGHRSGENPAQWRGHLSHLLPGARKLSRGHHAAAPWREVPGLMAKLRGLDSVSALALEWTILTCARTGETIGATWSEIDRENAVWIVPAARMKAKREHRVPLSARCIEILAEAERLAGNYLFPSRGSESPLSNMAMAECLKSLRPEATVHGFRSTFRDWVGEATDFADSLAEAALAHVVGDKTERAYRRGDALERRRELMAAWDAYLSSKRGRRSLGKRKKDSMPDSDLDMPRHKKRA